MTQPGEPAAPLLPRSWDSYWAAAGDRDYWLEPARSVLRLLPILRDRNVTDVLDLGCGLGRHALALAEAGFAVTATDASDTALEHLAAAVEDRHLPITIRHGRYLDRLFDEGAFDFVLAYNVLYHGGRGDFSNAIALVASYLRPGGLFLLTCPSRRDGKYGRGPLVAPHTYRPENSVHPGDVHYFTDEADLRELLGAFTILNLNTDEHYWQNAGVRHFSSYWEALCEFQPWVPDPP